MDYSDAPAKLHLLACWLDDTSVRTFHMTVHTIDDTVALVESTRALRGQLFLKRNKLPFIKKGFIFKETCVVFFKFSAFSFI